MSYIVPMTRLLLEVSRQDRAQPWPLQVGGGYLATLALLGLVASLLLDGLI